MFNLEQKSLNFQEYVKQITDNDKEIKGSR